MKKIDRNDWFIHGLNVLADEGFAKVTIDNLCSELKVTKGSFYHHFGNMDGYIEALMNYWLEVNTLSFIRESEMISNPVEKRNFLYTKSMAAEHRYEQAIRAWGFSNSLVKRYVHRVDSDRIAYLTNLNASLGENLEQAQNRAILDYATLVGLQQLYPEMSESDLRKIYNQK